jgi:hypothetical protein
VPASTLLDRGIPSTPAHPTDGQPVQVHPDQMVLPFIWEVGPGVPSVPPLPRHLHLVGSDSAATPSSASPSSTSSAPPLTKGSTSVVQPASMPSAAWVARIARAIVEVADGDRPAGQLNRWVDRAPLAMLSARGVAYRRHPAVRDRRNSLSAARATQQVRAVRLCPVSSRAVEASAVLVGGGRGRALALRLEARGSDWIVAAVALG